MAQRLIKLYLPDSAAESVTGLFDEGSEPQVWSNQVDGGVTEFTFLVEAGDTGELLDRFERRYGHIDGYRVVIVAVAASLPRAEEDEEDDAESDGNDSNGSGAISRAELIEEVGKGARFNSTFVVLVVLSSVVSVIGMLRDDATILIGAMVIAPLLGPNVALGLATTLADRKLAASALKTSFGAVLIILAMAVPVGAIFRASLFSSEIVNRTRVDLSDLLVALAAGVAGALSITTGVPAALIGVMVAVALLPPLIAVGMMAGSGNWTPMLGALLLFVVNVVSVNLAAVGTFLAQGIRPGSWLEARAARQATRTALLIWLGLLVLLIAVIVIADPNTNFRLVVPQ